MDYNFLIGKDGGLPWKKIPMDMARFQNLTLGKPVIMGRKTLESIGKALPGRDNVVLTRSYVNPCVQSKQDCKYTECDFVQSIGKALVKAHKYAVDRAVDEIMIIGGREIYIQFMPYTNRLYLTFVRLYLEGDTYFPITAEDIMSRWTEDKRECEVNTCNVVLVEKEIECNLLFQTFNRNQ